MTLRVVVLFLWPLLARGEDSVTLNSGEIMRGRIVSETDQQLEIEVANADRTILVKRAVPRAEIRSVQRETPEQAAERKSFETLARYKLDPNSAYPTNYYPAVITAFGKFLATYPRSEHAPQVSALLADWKAEYPQAVLATQKGLVKFRGHWLTPEQAQATAEQERRRKDDLRRQQDEARRRQAEQSEAARREVEESSRQQPPNQDKSQSPTAAPRGGRYDVEVPAVVPY